MKEKSNVPPEAIELRRQAEIRLSRQKSRAQTMNYADNLGLIHELEVHQIELEMQNDELTRARLALETLLHQYTDLYEFAPVGYLTISQQDRILKINISGAKLLGAPRSLLVNQRFSRFISRDDQDTHYKHFKQLFETEEPDSYDLRLVIGDLGQIVWLHLAASAAQDANGATIFRVVVSDINDRVEAEQLKKAEVQRIAAWQERQNIARILHDSITQQVSGLLLLAGTAQSRLEKGSYEKIPIAISQITKAARQALADLRALINELKLENFRMHDFELITVLSDRFQTIISGAGLKLKMDLPDCVSLPSNQQREIYFILIESLNNILRHSGADQVSLQATQDGEKFSVEIIDNGCGFDPHKSSGGMGLTNMKFRADQIGANMLINSVHGAGTLIRLDLPFRQGNQP